MKIHILASGSAGNATLVSSGDVHILIDSGLTCKQLTLRMAQVGVNPSDLAGIFLTHSHGDHVSALKVMAKKTEATVYATSGTQDALNLPFGVCTIQGGKTMECGPLEIEPFSIPHDADEPVGYLVRDGDETFGICTDLGTVTLLVIERLKECTTFLLESNYDQQMIMDPQNQRPWATRQRAASRMGHLSTRQCADALKQIVNPRTRKIILGHVSKTFCTTELARSTAQAALDEIGSKIPLQVIDPSSTTVTTL